MSVNIPTWYVNQYNQNIQMLVQQKVSRLRSAVTTGSHVGQQASPVDQIGTVEMVDVTSRFSPMGRVDAPTDRRWVAPFDADLPQLIDTFDKLKILTDPNGIYVTNAVAAANRKFDDRIGTAFFAAAQTGVAGTTSTVFDSTNQVVGVNVGGTASGLNVAKLERGRRLLLSNEVALEDEQIFVAITAVDHESLMNEIQVISSDFNTQPAYDQNGIIKFWRGFHFIHSERSWITTTATDDQSGTSRALPMWVKSGMYLGVWNEIETAIDVRADIQSRPWQAYTKMSANATRIEEKKVVKIWAH
ncbi:MAG: phage capsid protein [Pseudomonadota bacterium]